MESVFSGVATPHPRGLTELAVDYPLRSSYPPGKTHTQRKGLAMKNRTLVTALLACLLVVFNACDSESRPFDPTAVLDPGGDGIDDPVPEDDCDDDNDGDDEPFPDGDDDDDDDF